MGEGGRYLAAAQHGRFIAIGWNTLGDLTWLTQDPRYADRPPNTFKDEIKNRYGQTWSATKIGNVAGQVWRLVVGIGKDDVVLARDSVNRQVIIGRVIGGYEFNPEGGDECPYHHRRTVDWVKNISRDAMSQKLKDSMTADLTIFSVRKHAHEIEELLAGRILSKTGGTASTQRLGESLVQRLLDFSPREFEEFTTDLLSTLGFETTVTEFVGDKGVDIIGALNAEGIANIDLRVQVKRYSRGSVGIGEVLKIRGTLGPEEHGALLTTAKFTKAAAEEAQVPGKKPIALVDRDRLVDLILEHFDQLTPEYQQRLGLQKKNISLEDQFLMVEHGSA